MHAAIKQSCRPKKNFPYPYTCSKKIKFIVFRYCFEKLISIRMEDLKIGRIQKDKLIKNPNLTILPGL